jgi:hypothetical protein
VLGTSSGASPNTARRLRYAPLKPAADTFCDVRLSSVIESCAKPPQLTSASRCQITPVPQLFTFAFVCWWVCVLWSE